MLKKNGLVIGVIGLGVMGANHIRALHKNRRVTKILAFDTDESQKQKFINSEIFEFVPTIEQLCLQADGVVIATKTTSHFDIAKLVLTHGKHILVEKPVTQTLDQAIQLHDLASGSGKVCVGHIERFNPTLVELKKLLGIMQPIAVVMERLSFNISRATDVNVMLDLMLHDIDAAYYLFDGVIDHKYSLAKKNLTSVEDYCTAIFQSKDVPITITASKVSQVRKRIIQVTCLQGYIVADLDRKEIKILKNPESQYYSINFNLGYKHSSISETISVPPTEPLVEEHEQFIKLMLGEPHKCVTLDQAIEIQRLIEHTIL